MTFFFMCFADMAQTYHYSLVNQATPSSRGAECPCGCCGCSGGRQAGQGAAGTYFLQEWHSRGPGQPPRAWRWAGWAPRGAGFPHASHSRRTATPLLSSIIQAVFPAWNKEKQWKISSLLPARSSQRRGMRHDEHRPRAHTNPLAHTTAVTRHGLQMHPKDQLAQYLIFVLPCVPDPWSSCGEQARLQQPLWACAPSASPRSLIRVIAMEICYSNTEILELPRGEDLKGPQCDGWSLMHSSSAPKGHALFLADSGFCHPNKRVLGNFCVAVIPEGAVLKYTAPIPCFSCN